MIDRPNTEQAAVDDRNVDLEIATCLDLLKPRSFFLFAGAGSGKTKSLVTALKHVQKNLSKSLEIRGQKIGVITYTNAASDEIKRRLFFDPLIDVRTIHSFSWSLIDGLNNDIREWLRENLASEIGQLQIDEAKGRKNTKASATRIAKIAAKTDRLGNLNNIRRFIYSPTGDNRSRDSLNHAEVLKLTSSFLTDKPTMRSILVGRYPFLLIDESQDTNRHLIDALFGVQAGNGSRFVLGLFGDMMQRIYNDGKDGLGDNLPTDWATPSKKLNYRSPVRIVSLINKVRSAVDEHTQQAWSGSEDGFVRLFIVPVGTEDKDTIEHAAAARMAEVSEDENWLDSKTIKTLTLEHRMAAARMGFLDMFVPLYEVDSWRTGLLNGKLTASRFFTNDVLPLVKAAQDKDRFTIARIAKARSPLLSPDAIRASEDPKGQLNTVSLAIDSLLALFNNGADPKLLTVLRCIAESNLLAIPESLRGSVCQDGTLDGAEDLEEDEWNRTSKRAEAIEKFLDAPFSQVEPFAAYFASEAHFDTHQGVKGLEFDRVMVIMDDDEARGFSFKYEDLFGGKGDGSKTVAATRRLFYVTCSRARQSLALVAYTSGPDRVRDFVIRNGWFRDEEIISDIGQR